MPVEPILLAGAWRDATSSECFWAENPASRTALPQKYPLSAWDDCEAALNAATWARRQLRKAAPTLTADFLDAYAGRLESHSATICESATLETALPVSPRLVDVELPRTIGQLRQAAVACRDESWRLATIDVANNIRSGLESLGPVVVFGPNNFPLAFNGISGGDFAAAIAAGNPVIAKAHPTHPRTSQLLAEQAGTAATEVGLPAGTVQMLYAMSNTDGMRLVADPRVGAVGFTGSRRAGLQLKAAADAVGTPIYLEMSSINPVVFLPGAIDERGGQLVDELAGSCLLGGGQFCTCPKLILLLAGDDTERLIEGVRQQFATRPVGALLGQSVCDGLQHSVAILRKAGAEVLIGGEPVETAGYAFANTLLRVDGTTFLFNPHELQTEAFGNASTFVVADDQEQLVRIVEQIEGSLTGSIYSASDASDDPLYNLVADALKPRVGRLLNDKMPTGVAVSPAMNHGGPYPATGHPGFTAVGLPASMRRFAKLQCYDNVRRHRLPVYLRDKNPNGAMWRLIDGQWTQGDVVTC